MKKVQFFENLANVAGTNTETDLAISLYDELINLIPEFRFPKGLGHIGCFTENKLKSCIPDVKKKIHGLTYREMIQDEFHFFIIITKRCIARGPLLRYIFVLGTIARLPVWFYA